MTRGTTVVSRVRVGASDSQGGDTRELASRDDAIGIAHTSWCPARAEGARRAAMR